MKELSVEQKAKAYDEAYKKVAIRFGSNVADEIFPELKESEDEKWIPKELAKYLKEKGGYRSCWIAWLEKQGEQKPVDKVEPKFKVGDFIVNDYCMGRVVKITNDAYLLDTEQGIPFSSHSTRLWDITKDAKDGDVLCYKDEISLYKHDIKNCTKEETTFGGFVYHCCYYGKRFIMDSLYSLTEQDKMDIHPATKEQCNLLFSKIKESGYEWDAENKQLKKIEQSKLTAFEEEVKDMIDDHRDAIGSHNATIEEVKERAAYMLSLIPQNPAWSEEDENTINHLLAICAGTKRYRQFAGCSQDDVVKYQNWLKSLKDRVQPKYEWSEEDKLRLKYLAGNLQ